MITRRSKRLTLTQSTKARTALVAYVDRHAKRPAAALQRLLGCSRATAYRIYRGKQKVGIRREYVARAAYALNILPTDIYGSAVTSVEAGATASWITAKTDDARDAARTIEKLVTDIAWKDYGMAVTTQVCFGVDGHPALLTASFGIGDNYATVRLQQSVAGSNKLTMTYIEAGKVVAELRWSITSLRLVLRRHWIHCGKPRPSLVKDYLKKRNTIKNAHPRRRN